MELQRIVCACNSGAVSFTEIEKMNFTSAAEAAGIQKLVVNAERLQKTFVNWIDRCRQSMATGTEFSRVGESVVTEMVLQARRVANGIIRGTAKSSTRSVEGLEWIEVSKLRVGPNRGFKLRATVCETPVAAGLLVGVKIQDPSGGVAALRVHNFGEDTPWLLKAGTRFVIKEPTYEVHTCGTVTIGLRFPNDLVVLDDVDYTDHEAAKDRGDELGAHGFSALAIAAYTEGLQHAAAGTAERGVLLAARAECRLETEAFGLALDDAEAATEEPLPDAARESTQQTVGEALIGLGHWERAATILPTEANARRREAEEGIFDWPQLAASSPYVSRHPDAQTFKFDVSEYVNPKVQLQLTASGGRGFVARDALRTGELVVVSKAFGVAVCDADEPATQCLLRFEVRRQLLRAIHENPDRLAALNALQVLPGTRVPGEPGPIPITKVGGRLSPPPLTGGDSEDDGIAVDRMDCIVATNCFGDTTLGVRQLSLHILGSLFNGSLYPNVSWWSTGDVGFFRVNRPVAHGEELRVSYTAGSSFEDAKRIAAKHAFDAGERALWLAADPDGELESKIRELSQKCCDGKTNARLAAKLLTRGKLHPHPDLAAQYEELGFQFDGLGRNDLARVWVSKAIGARNRRDPFGITLLNLHRTNGNYADAQRITTLFYGEGTWPVLEPVFGRPQK